MEGVTLNVKGGYDKLYSSLAAKQLSYIDRCWMEAISKLQKTLTSSCDHIDFNPIFRERLLKEEIEKYRQERPKIQQQFSDLKVRFDLIFQCR